MSYMESISACMFYMFEDVGAVYMQICFINTYTVYIPIQYIYLYSIYTYTIYIYICMTHNTTLNDSGIEIFA